MTHYQDPITRLLSTGLYLIPEDPDYVSRSVQHLAEQTRELHFFRYCSVKRFSQEIQYDEKGRRDFPLQVNWLIKEQLWCLLLLGGHGAYHNNDFICHYHTFEEVIDVIIEYYFGNPEIIDDWEIAFHRHPEIVKAQAKQAIIEAKQMKRSDFEDLRMQYKEHYRAQGIQYSWELALQTEFHIFPHQTRKNSMCALLRNGEKAYTISD